MPQFQDPHDPHSAQHGHGGHDGDPTGGDSRFDGDNEFEQRQESLDSRFGADEGGRPDAPHSQFDHDAGSGAQEDLVDVNDVGEVNASRKAAAKDKPPKKRLSVGVIAGGLVLLGAFGWVATTVMSASGGAKPKVAQPVAAGSASDIAPLGGAPATPGASAMAAAPAAALPMAAMASAADMAAGNAAVAPAANLAPAAPTGGGAAPAVAMGGVPAAAMAAAGLEQENVRLQKELAQLRNDKLALEGALGDQSRTLDQLNRGLKDGTACVAAGHAAGSAAARASRASAAAPAAGASAKGARHAAASGTRTASATTGASAAKSRTKAQSGSSGSAVAKDGSAELDGALTLKAVSPPSGPNMRAWIMDGDRLLSVVVGDSVRGARVVSISGREVATTQGVIRGVN